ncbi:hypothetical protein D3C72_1121900 [compost metagenome]
MVGGVLGVVDVGLVEHHGLAIAPVVALAVDVDVAAFDARRPQAQVVAQRTGERVAVAHEAAARGQLGEHRGLDGADALEQLGGARAQHGGRGVRLVVPLQVEALPAALEEGVEAHVVELARGLDAAAVAHGQRLFADHFPVFLEDAHLGELRGRQVRRTGHLREKVHEDVQRRQEGRVIRELSEELVPDLATEVNVECAEHEDGKNDPLHW